MSAIYIIGVGMTRFGKFLERSVKDLAHEAVRGALADAGAQMSDVGAAFYSNTGQGAIEGQIMVGGQVALRSMGFAGIPITNVENACASGSTALHLACTYLRAGAADVALAVGVEKMFHPDKARTNALFDGAWDVHEVDATLAALAAMGAGVAPADGRKIKPSGSVFMDLYASLAREHMKMFGTTERQLAAVSAKNHRHSTMNPLSQYQNDMSVDEVLGARMIAWPLTLPMCSPISDGAAAAVLCTEDALARFGARGRAIKVLASVLASGSDRTPGDVDRHLCRLAARKAYETAAIGPQDISVAEVHDASAYAEILQTENLGFCEFGQGGWIAERGETALGGRIPVNPSGGLESKGHPIGATGLGQIHELVAQLRGEAGPRQVDRARFALAENGGGFFGIEEAAATVTILGVH